jgi:UDP-glucose 4-epimerase
VRYLITGGSGYIGTRLVARLSERDEIERLTVADVRPPRTFGPKVAYEEVDVRDRARVHRLLEHERPDVLVHLAFVLNPMHDEHAMYGIDVGGTQNVLEAASAAGIEQVLVTSSATAYGAFPDNPVPLTEEHPVRGVADFEYARDKAECDRLCQLWACRHPDRVMTIVRPCIVFGPTVDNYISRSFTDQPFFADFGEGDVPIQFVHEDDVVEALVRLLEGRHSGAFNVGPDDWMTVTECAETVGLRTIRVPFGPYRALAQAMWRLHRVETPAGNLSFVRYPWVVSNAKLRETLDWAPRHSSRETFEITMRARGLCHQHHGEHAPVAGTAAG